jgi:hypothetical protein
MWMTVVSGEGVWGKPSSGRTATRQAIGGGRSLGPNTLSVAILAQVLVFDNAQVLDGSDPAPNLTTCVSAWGPNLPVLVRLCD